MALSGSEAQASALAMIGRMGPIPGVDPTRDPAEKIRSRLNAADAIIRAAALAH